MPLMWIRRLLAPTIADTDTAAPAPSTPLSIALGAAKFNPTEARQEFTDNAELWQLYLDLTELDRNTLSERLIDKHHEDENEEKYEARQAQATIINLVPTILDCIRQYLFANEPVFDAGGDAALDTFLHDCDGNGTAFAQHVRSTVLPMALALGWVDSLVQNPLMESPPVTELDAQNAGVAPRVVTLLPTQRINWSALQNHAYLWATFKDSPPERPSPLEPAGDPVETYITLMRAGVVQGDGVEQDKAVWIRSSGVSGKLNHVIDYAPTQRVPVASMYYKLSNDPKRRHFGLSKIATIAILTRKIANVLSWTDEDMLANLALICIPTKGGRKPKDEEGSETVTEFSAFSVLWIDDQAKTGPAVVQGHVDHIRVKLALVDMLIREVLRLSHLSTATGEGGANKETSGFHAVVNRNELFQELDDLSGALDRYCLDVFALVKSWAQNADVGREDLGNATAKFNKGNWTIDPAAEIIRACVAASEAIGRISPTFNEKMYQTIARAMIDQDDPKLEKIDGEITKWFSGQVIEEPLPDESAEALERAAAIAGDHVTLSAAPVTPPPAPVVAAPGTNKPPTNKPPTPAAGTSAAPPPAGTTGA